MHLPNLNMNTSDRNPVPHTLCTSNPAPLTNCILYIVVLTLCIMYPVPYIPKIPQPVLYTLFHAPYTLYTLTVCTIDQHPIHSASCTLLSACLIHCTLFPVCTLCHVAGFLLLAPCTLGPRSMYPTPTPYTACTLYPSTLVPAPGNLLLRANPHQASVATLALPLVLPLALLLPLKYIVMLGMWGTDLLLTLHPMLPAPLNPVPYYA